MSLIYTRSLGAGSTSGTADILLWTVKPTEQLVLRDIVFSNPSAATIRPSLFAATGMDFFNLLDQDVPAGAQLHVEMRQALESGWTLNLRPVGSYFTYSVTGYIFLK